MVEDQKTPRTIYKHDENALLLKRAESAETCINEIQDLFEYSYASMSAESIKNYVIKKLDAYTARVCEK